MTDEMSFATAEAFLLDPAVEVPEPSPLDMPRRQLRRFPFDMARLLPRSLPFSTAPQNSRAV